MDDPCEAAFSAADPIGPRKYYRARYYDPRIGRFISEDPSGDQDGPNRYSYVHDNPVNAVDPSGLGLIKLDPKICIAVRTHPTPKRGNPSGLWGNAYGYCEMVATCASMVCPGTPTHMNIKVWVPLSRGVCPEICGFFYNEGSPLNALSFSVTLCVVD